MKYYYLPFGVGLFNQIRVTAKAKIFLDAKFQANPTIQLFRHFFLGVHNLSEKLTLEGHPK